MQDIIRTIRCFQEGGGFTSLEWDGTTIKIGDCLLLQAGSGSLLFKTRNISKSSITAADVDDEYPEKYRKKECGPPSITLRAIPGVTGFADHDAFRIRFRTFFLISFLSFGQFPQFVNLLKVITIAVTILLLLLPAW